MNKNLLLSGIAGTIVYYLLGWLVYSVLFPEMASGDESPIGIFLGCLFYVFIYALIFVRWAHITTFKSGFNASVILGLLYALSWHSFSYDGNLDLANSLKEIISGVLMIAIAGGVVGLVNGKFS